MKTELSSDGRYPIRRGVVAALDERDGIVVEIGLFPFHFIAPQCRIAWEAGHLLRAGPHLEPIDVWTALGPMHDVLEAHQVRMTEVAEVADVGDPHVRAALDVDLVIVLDHASDSALDWLPFPVLAPRAVLADVIHWTVFYSSVLLAPWIADESSPSVLRTCALGGLALDSVGQVIPPLSYIFAAHRDQFPELSWDSPDAVS